MERSIRQVAEESLNGSQGEIHDVSHSKAGTGWLWVLDVVLIFAAQALYAGGASPDVNEAHYLTRAKHYWNPDWCVGDHFLESREAHIVFCWVFGWLTRWFSLPVVAWTGRVITWTLMALAWRRLSVAVLSVPLGGFLAMGLFLGFSYYCQMMGEWVVGGVEGKSLAYVLVVMALGALVRQRWNQAWLWIGAASSLHVLAGGWSAVALGFSWLLAPAQRPSLKQMIPGLTGGLLLALLGLLPAVALTWGLPASELQQANTIYVFHRLPHHLLLQERPFPFVFAHLTLLSVWIVLVLAAGIHSAERRLQSFVLGAVLIAVAGTIIAFVFRDDATATASWMRYYWFRLSDAVLPMGAAFVTVAVATYSVRWPRWWSAAPVVAVALVSVAVPAVRVVDRWRDPRPAADISIRPADRTGLDRAWDKYQDWRKVCAWVAQSTDPDDRFLTPYQNQTFKWYAGRSEVVTWKDVPQDAININEWWRRISTLQPRLTLAPLPHSSGQSRNSLAEWTEAELLVVARRYGCRYVVFDHSRIEPNLGLEKRVYPENDKINHSYSVYRVPP